MARNKTLFLYNDTKHDQEWTIYSEGVVNQRVTVGQQRKSFTVSLSDDVTIQIRGGRRRLSQREVHLQQR